MQTSRGGQNIIISNGQIISYETCGSEGSGVTYSRGGYSKKSLQRPNIQAFVCRGGLTPRQYFVGPSGITYYSSSGRYAYIPLGLGSRYYFIDNVGYRFDRGRILDTTTLSC